VLGITYDIGVFSNTHILLTVYLETRVDRCSQILFLTS